MRTVDQTNSAVSAIDPRTGEESGSFVVATPEDVVAAAEAARGAFLDPRLADPDRRVGLLRGAAAGLREQGEAIVATAEAETGLPTARLQGELERTARQLEAFADLAAKGDYVDAYIDPPDPEAKPIPRPDVRRMLDPIGPVAVFGASNFPLAFSVAGGDTAAALAAGCPVVVKGHRAHPGTGELVAGVLAAAVESADLPTGTFSFLKPGPREIGEQLVDREEIAAVAITGSFAAGMALYRRAAARRRPIPVYAEMSSINPLVITPGALAARADELAAGLATAVGGSAGQLCTKPGLIFVPAGESGDGLVTDVAGRLEEMGPLVMLTEGIRRSLLERCDELDSLVDPVGSPPPLAVDGPGSKVVARLYTTDAATLAASEELEDEAFGPVAVVVRYRDESDLLHALDSLAGQLTGTIHAEPDELAESAPVIETLRRRVGRLIFDGYPTGVAVTSAMQHGGPFPATTDAGRTSVGMTAIERFLRPVAWQGMPGALLPAELQDGNPRGIARRVDGLLQLP